VVRIRLPRRPLPKDRLLRFQVIQFDNNLADFVVKNVPSDEVDKFLAVLKKFYRSRPLVEIVEDILEMEKKHPIVVEIRPTCYI